MTSGRDVAVYGVRSTMEEMKRIILVAAMTSIGACSSTSIKTATTFEEPGYEDASFSNVLVIGVAGSYDTRARFEREMANALNSSGVSGTAYYSVIGRNKDITRSDVTDAVRARGFDSVILTRVTSSQSEVTEKRGASTAQAARKDADNLVNLFRYDYEVLNNPSTINVASTVVLLTEVFSAAEEKRVFAMETTVSDKENISFLVDEAVSNIVSHMQKNGTVGR